MSYNNQIVSLQEIIPDNLIRQSFIHKLKKINSKLLINMGTPYKVRWGLAKNDILKVIDIYLDQVCKLQNNRITNRIPYHAIGFNLVKQYYFENIRKDKKNERN